MTCDRPGISSKALAGAGELKMSVEGQIYTLTSAARPRLADVDRETEAQVVYRCLEPYGSTHTFEQLIEAATYRKIQALSKTAESTTVRACVKYHLKRFQKNNIVRVVEG